MFAVLFLGARMRALNLDPPLGIPPFWLQCCFYLVTTLLIIETAFAMVLGFKGTPKETYYGVHTFHCDSRATNIGLHVCALLAYALLIPISIGVYLMKDARETIGGDVNPL